MLYITASESTISHSALHLSLKIQEIKEVFSKGLRTHYVYIRQEKNPNFKTNVTLNSLPNSAFP